MTENLKELPPPDAWMKPVMRAAGIYNLMWGAWVVLFPIASLKVCGYPAPPTYPELWQCIGMIVGVYGIGYWISASDPYRHWPVILVGFLGKIFGPIGFAVSWLDGRLPLSAGIVNIFNDVIWWVPFAIILWRALRYHQTRLTTNAERVEFEEAVRTFRSQTGETLLELSKQRPTLVVFLRHSGCTFCRQMLSEIEQQREEIASRGVGLAIVHMESDPERARQMFKTYHLDDVPQFTDPSQKLYQAFDVGLARFSQILSGRVLAKGYVSAIAQRHGFSRIRGNAFRLPGTFLLKDGEIIARHVSRDAADHPDLNAMICEI